MAPRGRFSRLSAQLGDGLDALRVIAEEVAAARTTWRASSLAGWS
ncbi:MAG: hypothetical protein RDU89_11035 [bacterium]|nr:hypothetical protein [bacterium]